jgi:maleamate amidohydrolase
MDNADIAEYYTRVREEYRVQEIGARMGFGDRPAVIVVDFSRGFTDPSIPGGNELGAEIEATREVLDVARSVGALIVFLTTGYNPDLKDGGRFIEKVPGLARMQLGSKWLEIDDRLGRLPTEHIITKKFSSGFLGTNLNLLLTSQHIDTTILVGTSTSGCVRAAAHDSCSSGYHTIVVEECVGDRAVLPHLANLFDMDTKYADVEHKSTVLDYLATIKDGVRV